MRTEPVSEKARWALRIFLGAFLLITLRVWHLEVIQREQKQKESENPKRRTIVQKANRGVISDRFHVPLAVNKICYGAAVYYNQIAQIPAVAWKENIRGKKARHYPRREYIRELSEGLALVLGLSAQRIEDLIHSKAALFPHVPFILKSGLTEEEHYRLSLMEKDFPGLHAEINAERFYPHGKVGGEIIGSMGSISSKQYFTIAEEIQNLQKMIQETPDYELPPETLPRLQELKEHAYTIQDLVGKTGIEKQYEEQLRGFYGKKIFEVDQKGKYLKELLPTKPSTSGQEITLTLSIELQEFAEALLAEHEQLREGRSLGFDPEAKERKPLKQPWIKGGSVVALDPKTGEVIAMASTPRFDPNDFIPSSNASIQSIKQKNISRWLENERLIASIWDGKQLLIRERHSARQGFYEESTLLTWERFLDMTLSAECKAAFQRLEDVKTAAAVQEDFESLLYHSQQRSPAAVLEQLKTNKEPEAKRLELILTSFAPADRILAIDLCRLVVHAPAFTDESLQLLGSMKLAQYRALNQAFCVLENNLKESAKKEFEKTAFQTWRENHQKTYLTEKRSHERAQKIAARPYIDYLDRKLEELFNLYWSEHRLDSLLEAVSKLPEFAPLIQLCKTEEQIKAALHTFRAYSDLQRPLLGHYRFLRKKGDQTEKELAAAFYPIGGFGFSNSYAFQGTSPQGSIFKLITAFAALSEVHGENPLTLIDEIKNSPPKQIVATSLTGLPYMRMYKGGRLPRSHHPNTGKIDLIGALEQSSNSYFSILAGDVLQNPEDLNHAARLFGLGAQTGIDLPGEAKGKLPDDLNYNRTGLYSTAIGQHKLLVTPLQTAIMLAAIANGGNLYKPILTKNTKGNLPNRSPFQAFERNAFAQKELAALGISFPLFTAAATHANTPTDTASEPHILRSINLSPKIRSQLLEGMDRTVWTNKGTARPGVIRNLLSRPALLSQYLALKHQMVGKTSTAEILFNPYTNPSSLPAIYKHIWFGAISFDAAAPEATRWDYPELIVVVYLRYGDGGKEAAPLAAQVIQKWREISSRHSLKK